MAGTRIGIDLGTAQVAVVHRRGDRLESARSEPVSGPSDWGAALRRHFPGGAPRGARITVAVPRRLLLVKRIHLPPQARRRWDEILPFTLEEMLPFPLSEAVVAYGEVEPSQGQLLAVCARRKDVQEILAACAEAGLRPHALLPDCLLWPWHPRLTASKQTSVMVVDVGAAGLRCHALVNGRTVRSAEHPRPDGIPAASEAEQQWLDEQVRSTLRRYRLEFAHSTEGSPGAEIISDSILVGGAAAGGKLRVSDSPAQVMPDGATALATAAAAAPVKALVTADLLQALEAASSEKRRNNLAASVRAVVGILVLAMGFELGRLWVERDRLEHHRDVLKREEQRLFLDTFPQVKRIAKPVSQAREQIRKLIGKTGGGPKENAQRFLDMLLAISRSAPPGLELTGVNRAGGGLTLRGLANEAAVIDQFQQNLVEELGSEVSTPPELSDVKGRWSFTLAVSLPEAAGTLKGSGGR